MPPAPPRALKHFEVGPGVVRPYQTAALPDGGATRNAQNCAFLLGFRLARPGVYTRLRRYQTAALPDGDGPLRHPPEPHAATEHPRQRRPRRQALVKGQAVYPERDTAARYVIPVRIQLGKEHDLVLRRVDRGTTICVGEALPSRLPGCFGVRGRFGVQRGGRPSAPCARRRNGPRKPCF